MPLSKARQGDCVEIIALDTSEELARRFEALGLLAGERLSVLRNSGRTPLLIAASGTRLMIGRELASRLTVRPVAGGLS